MREWLLCVVLCCVVGETNEPDLERLGLCGPGRCLSSCAIAEKVGERFLSGWGSSEGAGISTVWRRRL